MIWLFTVRDFLNSLPTSCHYFLFKTHELEFAGKYAIQLPPPCNFVRSCNHLDNQLSQTFENILIFFPTDNAWIIFWILDNIGRDVSEDYVRSGFIVCCAARTTDLVLLELDPRAHTHMVSGGIDKSKWYASSLSVPETMTCPWDVVGVAIGFNITLTTRKDILHIK